MRLVWETRNMPNGVMYGIGVDENTALVVDPANEVSSEGEVRTIYLFYIYLNNEITHFLITVIINIY